MRLRVWSALIVVFVMSAVLGLRPSNISSEPAPPFETNRTSKLVVTAGMFDFVFGGGTRPEPPDGWEDRRNDDMKRPGRNDQLRRSMGGNYRTLCVRLCDGFSFPISFSTTRDRFGRDARRCEQSCTRSRLFVHRSQGEDAEQMVDLEGRPYRELPTAFLHRTAYVTNCTCRGNPWGEEALARHRAYAEAAKGNTRAMTAELPPKVQQERGARQQDRWARSEWKRRRQSNND